MERRRRNRTWASARGFPGWLHRTGVIGTDVAPKQCQDQFYILTVGLGPLADVVAGGPREACRAGGVQTSCDLERSKRRVLSA